MMFSLHDRRAFALGFAFVAAAGVIGGGEALAQKKVLVIGGTSGAGVVTAATSGVAKIISQNSPIAVRVRNFSTPEAWLPELDSGKIDLGTHFAATAWLVYNQIDSNLELKNLRLVRSSAATTPIGFMVRADSDIKSVGDLKGKRVAGGYGGHPIMRRLAGGVLTAYGLGWSDVQMVPVPAAQQGSEALVDGRVDAAWYAVFAPATREAHTKIGVRFLPLDMTPERLEIVRKEIFPGILPIAVPADMPWAPKGTGLISYEYYVLASTHTDADSVKTVLETLWAHNEEVRKVHPVLRGFTNKAAVSGRPVIPYHSAAVEFYKSKGAWTAEAEAANAALSN